MDKVEFNHSLKNIPIADKKTYMAKLFDMTTKFIDRMKWKAFFFERRRELNESEHEVNNH